MLTRTILTTVATITDYKKQPSGGRPQVRVGSAMVEAVLKLMEAEGTKGVPAERKRWDTYKQQKDDVIQQALRQRPPPPPQQTDQPAPSKAPAEAPAAEDPPRQQQQQVGV